MGTLIYTVAQNGYASAYSRCIESQEAYSARYGFSYVAVTRPFIVRQPAHCAWLKISLMTHALNSGYEWVAFVDSDAMIRQSAPDFRCVSRPGKSVYMANGRTGRLNSGVVFAQRADDSIRFFMDVLNSATENIPEKDRAGLKFENGNVIYCASKTEAIHVIDPAWNNTLDPEMDDHVRHFTGPLQFEYKIPWLQRRLLAARRRLVAEFSSQPASRDADFFAELRRLTRFCVAKYPHLSAQ